MTRKILGISAFYHDSAAVIIEGNEIIAAVQEERFTRKKHDPSFPVNAIKYCLEESGFSLNELDAVVFYDKPLLKFERLLETYYGFAPKGILSFMKAMPVWLKEKMFLKKLIKDELKNIDPEIDLKNLLLQFPEHHLSHAASAFYPSPFEEAAVMTIDGVGEWATASFCHAKGNTIKILYELRFPHSLGLLYSAFTYFLGFRVNSGEYKLMGLAPYGDPSSSSVEKYVSIIKEHLIDLKEDGSLWLNQKYFQYATGLRMVNDSKWEHLFGFKRRSAEDEIEQHHCDLGLAIQKVAEEVVISMAKHLQKETGLDNLCLAGGVALNCVANGRLANEGIFKNIFIQPAAGDAGGALGAALASNYIHYDSKRTVAKHDTMKGAFLGPEFSDKEIISMCRKNKAVFEKIDDLDELTLRTAQFIADGDAVGWFQGRMEFGPRALGNRSILADPRNEEIQKKLNLKIKYRESFRPFAPSVLIEDANEFFEMEGDSPYMLMVQAVRSNRRSSLPANYHTLSVKEKLYHKRSDIPAVTHIDFTSRIQTVHKDTNEIYHRLISAFKKITGYGMLVNTSFNVRGEPIVCTPDDAYRCMMRTEMDVLVIGNYIFKRIRQPDFLEKDNWKEEFVLD